ncbi:Lrp/AsnC family transcriptional regulator [Candidatus Woesearchaeota archaeon]|nr:Lrp/AsnC family transcriptional regulator [Candidatus Woesearchaeota archaeon]
MGKLTLFQEQIVGFLSINSRKNLSSIRKKYNQSQQYINRTANKLITDGVIKDFYTLVDYSRFDLLNFRLYIRLNYQDEQTYLEFVEYLKQMPESSYIASIGGTFDIICTFLCPNASYFNKTLLGLLSNFSRLIMDYTVLTTIVLRSFAWKKITKDPHEIILGGDREPIVLSEMDKRIVSIFSKHPRKSCLEISREIGVSAKTVILRLKNLHRQEIILGFRPVLNIPNTRMNLMMVKYHNATAGKLNNFTKYLVSHPNVQYIVKTIGEWNIEIQFLTDTGQEYKTLEREIRMKFIEIIQEVNSIPVYETYKMSYYPGNEVN